MSDRIAKLIVPFAMLGCCAAGGYIAIFRPGLVSGPQYLGALIFFQVLLACLWSFRRRYFSLLIAVFFSAGIAVPLQDAWSQIRWLVLLVGAIGGYIVYMKDRQHYFGSIHLVALFAVSAALVSAFVSVYPTVSTLKAMSLLLLFMYAASGARLAIFGREELFFRWILMISEVLVYVSAVCYFVFGFPLYGNPNSLGAVMGVVCAPLLLWSVLTTEKPLVRRRRTFTLLLCLLLLFFSQARAGMLAGVVTCALCCLALRRYRILIQGSVFAVLLAVLAVILTPPDTGLDGMPVQHEGASFASYFLYKGQDASGVLGSRASPWQETATVIKEHPWFGSGFGTSPVWDMPEIQVGKYNSTSMTTREHGSSYLAIAEWVGLLGVMPFVLLLVLLVWHLSRILLWVTRTQNARHFCVPVSLVLIAGLIHAGFEDWLFAVGYYLTVLFWVLAFSLLDLLPPGLSASPHAKQVWPQASFPETLRAIPFSR